MNLGKVPMIIVWAAALVGLVTALPASANGIPPATLTIVATPPVGWTAGHAELRVNTYHFVDDWQVHLRVNDGNPQYQNQQLVTSLVHSTRFGDTGETGENGWTVIDCPHEFSRQYIISGTIHAQYVFHWTRSLSDGTNIDETVPKTTFSYLQPSQ